MLEHLTCARITELIQALPLVLECDKLRSGALRVATPFHYPNGETIDVFIDTDRDLLQDDYFFSDHGQTALYLRNAQIGLDTTARKKEVLGDILHGSSVYFHGSRLITRPLSADRDALSDAILRLSQACVRVSDFATHQRLRSANPFHDDIEDFFDASQLRWQSDVKLPPVYGKRSIRMDFEVKSGNKSTYVNILAAMNEAAAHSSANEIALKLGDLRMSGYLMMQQFVTVYNSKSSGIRSEDIERLQTLSNTVAFPEQGETLARLLKDDDSQSSLPIGSALVRYPGERTRDV